jgi:hypothetical protein
LIFVVSIGGTGVGDLVVREAAVDDETAVVDCLERVSCVEVSSLVIAIACIFTYLLFLLH